MRRTYRYILSLIVAITMVLAAGPQALADETTAAATESAAAETTPADTGTESHADSPETEGTTGAAEATETAGTVTEPETTLVPETTKAPEQPQAANQAAASLVQVVTGMPFEDGSVDVWMSGTGVYVGSGGVLSPSSAVSFSGGNDGRYLSIAAGKADLYARIGIDLNDYDTVKEKLAVYVCLPSGQYAVCEIKAQDSNLGLAYIEYGGTQEQPTAVARTSQELPAAASLLGFSVTSLENTEEAIAAGSKMTDSLTPAQANTSYVIAEDGTLTFEKKLNKGFLGGVLADDTGKIYGMISKINGQSAVFVSSDDIAGFLENVWSSNAEQPTEPITEPVTDDPGTEKDLTLIIERLELAVGRAKNLDLTGYTTNSVDAYQKAIADAEAVLGKVGATKAELESAGSALNDAKNALTLAMEPVQERPKQNPAMLIAIAVILFGLIGTMVFFIFKKPKNKDGEKENSEDKPQSDFMTGLTKLLGVTPKGEAKEKAEKKPADSKDKKKKSRKEEEENRSGDGRYGGEWARKSREAAEDRRSEDMVEEEESGTSVLDSGLEETTVLNDHAMTNAYLLNASGEKTPVARREFTIGKQRRQVTYCIPNPTVSRKHCIIKLEGKEYTVTDLGSTNGTMVNGIKIEPKTPVKLGDGFRLTISDEEYTFHIESGAKDD